LQKFGFIRLNPNNEKKRESAIDTQILKKIGVQPAEPKNLEKIEAQQTVFLRCFRVLALS